MTLSVKLALPEAPCLLVVRPDRVGDLIISTSCIRPIRRRFPGCKLYFCAAERMRPLLENHPDLDGFISNLGEIAGMKLDAVVHLHPDKECYLAAHRAGVPVRIGYSQRFRGHCLTHSLTDRRSEGAKHEAAYNFDLLRFLDVSQPDRLAANVHLAPPSCATLQTKLPWALEKTRFAVLHPSAHSPVARWPAENFACLIPWLQQTLQLHVVVTGADENDSLANCPSPVLNLAGRTDLGELGWLLRHSQVLVTRDTGPSHLGAAVGCPMAVLFGRPAPMYSPTRWRPLTDKAVVVEGSMPRGRFEGRDAHWRRCFAAIRVEEVQAAVQQALSLGCHGA